jgi:hypothetical protein
MGTQVQIAQTLDDEKAINQILLEKYSLRCLPRQFSSPNPAFQLLGDCDTDRQVLFCEQFQQVIMDNICPIVDAPGQYYVFPNNGLCIEWNRTIRKGQFFSPGRYYFDPSDPVSESSAAVLKQVMSLICRTIKKKYPKKSGTRFPIYLGPDLSRMIDSQEAQFGYPSGRLMPVESNP